MAGRTSSLSPPVSPGVLSAGPSMASVPDGSLSGGPSLADSTSNVGPPRCEYCERVFFTSDYPEEEEPPIKCTACGKADFCDKKCMNRAWDLHRPQCKITQAKNAKNKARKLQEERLRKQLNAEQKAQAAAAAAAEEADSYALKAVKRYDATEERDEVKRYFAAPFLQLKEAVGKDDAAAQYVFAMRLYEGRGGVKQSFRQAALWFRISATAGFTTAMGALGTCYLAGHGVDQSDEEGVRWYRLAAEAGQPAAQFALADCIEKGRGVPEADPVYAQALYELAASNGNEDALNLLNYRRHIAKEIAAAEAEAELRMTPIQKQQRDYLKWLAKPLADLMKASLEGDAAAQCVMGYKCATGKAGGEKVPEKEKAVIDENDFAGAQKRREEEEAEKKNKDGKPDYKAAAIWYQRSAAQGFALAQGAMGCFLFDGRGVPKKSRIEGLKYYKKAAEQGLPDACYCVGDSFEFGRGCLVNVSDAIVWYRKAIELGNCTRSKEALDRLGLSYDGEKERIESEQKAAKDAADAIQRARMAAAAAVADAKRKLALKQIKFGGVEKKE